MSESSISFGNHTFSAIMSAESHVRPNIVCFAIRVYGFRVTHSKSGLKPSNSTPEKMP